MSARDPFSDDGPEIVPPAELLRLRARLSRPPAPALRAQHLTAVAAAARQPGVAGQVGRFASRGARVAVAIVASLAITSGLAAAQVLPQPAQRLLSNVSDRFAPEPDAPPARSDEPDRDGGSPTTDSPSNPDNDVATTAGDGSDSDGGPTTSIASVSPTTTARVVVSAPTTTIPGPIGPGSPTDPTDPDPTDPTTTTTVDPGSTTTTTDPGSTTTTSTTTPDGSTTTTTEGTSP